MMQASTTFDPATGAVLVSVQLDAAEVLAGVTRTDGNGERVPLRTPPTLPVAGPATVSFVDYEAASGDEVTYVLSGTGLPNPIPNASFGTDVTGWSSARSTLTHSTRGSVRSGSARVEVTDPSGSQYLIQAASADRVPVSPETTVPVRADLLVEAAADFRVGVYEYDAGGALLASTYADPVTVQPGQWRTIAAGVPVGPTTATVRVVVNPWTALPLGYVYLVDAVAVLPADEYHDALTVGVVKVAAAQLAAPVLVAPVGYPSRVATALMVTGYEEGRPSAARVHDVIGRPDPVVTYDVARTRRGRLTYLARDYAAARALVDVYSTAQGTMLVRQSAAPRLDMYHVAHGTPLLLPAEPGGRAWTVEIDYAEVPRP